MKAESVCREYQVYPDHPWVKIVEGALRNKTHVTLDEDGQKTKWEVKDFTKVTRSPDGREHVLFTLKPAKEKPKYETAAHVRDRVVASSRCEIFSSGFYSWDGVTVPDYFEIRFTGEAAKIPASKNRRISLKSGRSIPNSKTTGYFWAMDSLFQAASLAVKAEAKHDRFPVPMRWYAPEYKDLSLFVLVISCKRSAVCDLDNVLVSVRDWLEPSGKLKGGKNSRGWGIGLVDDDKHVQGMVVPSKLCGLESEVTRILIRPLECVRPQLTNFLAGVQI